jgi:hypothetical protein
MANVAKGLDQIGEIAECLNDIIINTGKSLQKDNKTIWEGFLHRWDNQDWLDMLEGFHAISESSPESVRPYHKNNAEMARTAILKNKAKSDRVLDTKLHKHTAWAMINTFREVWNNLHDKNIPNEDSKIKKSKHKVVVEQTEEYTRTTIFHNLFELEDAGQ